MITLSIDVTLLDKARFREVIRKNGNTAKFCDLVMFETPNGESDYLVKQGVSKEERAQRVEMPILGNGKKFESRGGQRPAPPAKSKESSFDDSNPPF